MIKASGTSLTLNGQPYKVMGLNCYQLAAYQGVNNYTCGGMLSDSVLDAFFAVQPPYNLTRMWAFQEHCTNLTTRALDWTPLDRVFAAAEKHNQYLLLTLANQWTSCDGSVQKNLSWYSGGWKVKPANFNLSYADWVAAVVSRYASSPALGMWSPINEGRVEPTEQSEAQACVTMRGWYDEVGAIIRAHDPNHLITAGLEGHWGGGSMGANYQTVCASPGIDVCTYHDYHYVTTPVPNEPTNGLVARIQQAQALNKPILTEEAGVELPTEVATQAQRASELEAKYKAQTAAGTCGLLMWSWAETENGVTKLAPGDPALSLLANTAGTAPVTLGGLELTWSVMA